MKLILPFPPSVNGYWRNVSGRTLISAKGREYRANVFGSLIEQLRAKPKAIIGELEVSLILHPPNREIRDLDNFQKALFDALTHACVWQDDSQVKKMLVEWGEIVPGGRAEIVIENYRKGAPCE